MITTNQIYELIIRKLDWKLKGTVERYVLVQKIIQEHESLLVDYQSSNYFMNNAILKKSNYLFENQNYGKIMDMLINYTLFFDENILNDQQQKYRYQQENSKEPRQQKTYRKAIRREVLERVMAKDLLVRGKEKERARAYNKDINDRYQSFIAPQPVTPQITT
jgi:hypothetical protein